MANTRSARNSTGRCLNACTALNDARRGDFERVETMFRGEQIAAAKQWEAVNNLLCDINTSVGGEGAAMVRTPTYAPFTVYNRYAYINHGTQAVQLKFEAAERMADLQRVRRENSKVDEFRRLFEVHSHHVPPTGLRVPVDTW